MKKITIVYRTLLIICICSSIGLVNSAYARKDSLYKRIGGYDVLARFSVELIDKFSTDPTFIRFDEGEISHEEDLRVKQLATEYFCQITNGPCFYTGKDMLALHTGMKITNKEWVTLMVHASELVDHWRIKSAYKKEFLHIFDNLKKVIDVRDPS